MRRRREEGGGGFLGALGTLAGGVAGFALGGPAGAGLGSQLGGAAGGVAGAVASNGGQGGGGSVPVNTDSAMQRRLAANSNDSLTQLREAQTALAQLPDPNLRKQYAAPLVQAEQALRQRGMA